MYIYICIYICIYIFGRGTQLRSRSGLSHAFKAKDRRLAVVADKLAKFRVLHASHQPQEFIRRRGWRLITRFAHTTKKRLS